MGSPSRQPDPALTVPVRRQLAEQAPRFEFFQLVRLLQKGLPENDPVGGAAEPANETVRFGVHPSLAFPPCEVRALSWNQDAPPSLAIHFFGLIGPVGVLPTHYTAYLLERLAARDTTLREFLDLFHHRLLSLFYRAWEKYRFQVPYERGEVETFTQHLMDLIGLGTPGLHGRQAVDDQSLLFYTGLIAPATPLHRSTAADSDRLFRYRRRGRAVCRSMAGARPRLLVVPG